MSCGEDFTKWIEESVRTLPPGTLLPGDSALARQWHLSTRTVRRLMSALGRKGIIVRGRGKGTYVPSEKPAPLLGSFPQATSAERIRKQLMDSISEGYIRRGEPLPQVKFLSLQYKISQRTITGAYRQLEAEGIVSRIGKRFWVGGFAPFAHSALKTAAYLAVPEPGDFGKIFSNEELSQAYIKMERELRSCGILLKYCLRSELHSMISRWVASKEYPCGLALWKTTATETRELVPLLKPLVERQKQLRIPVLVDLAEIGGISDVPYDLKIVSRGNLTTTRARSLARYVNARGFRSVTFVYPSGARGDLRNSLLRYQKMAHEVRLHIRASHQLRQVLVSEDSSLTGDSFYREIVRKDSRYLQYLRDKYENGRRSATGLASPIRVVPSLKQLPMNSSGGALWICASDNVASDALTMLKERGIAVPEEMSVLTLENSPEYLPLGATASAIDYDLVGYIMAHSLIGDIPLKKTSKGFLRIECEVIERLT